MQLSDRPIFIVGSPRSGTSLITEMIDAHPNIFAPYWETGIFIRFNEMLNDHLATILKNNKETFPFERADILQWMRESVISLFSQFAMKSGKWRWAEKTPGHVFTMGLMHEMFPNAQFIHMIRNGRDVVRSLMQMQWSPRKVSWGIKHWMHSVEAGRQIGNSLSRGNYIEIRYEKLIEDPKATLESVCEFLGETYSQRMFDFHRPENNSWGINLPPIQNKPVNHHPKLNLMQQFLVTLKASRLLRKLGYN